jgi:hypothetical protein
LAPWASSRCTVFQEASRHQSNVDDVSGYLPSVYRVSEMPPVSLVVEVSIGAPIGGGRCVDGGGVYRLIVKYSGYEATKSNISQYEPIYTTTANPASPTDGGTDTYPATQPASPTDGGTHDRRVSQYHRRRVLIMSTASTPRPKTTEYRHQYRHFPVDLEIRILRGSEMENKRQTLTTPGVP